MLALALSTGNLKQNTTKQSDDKVAFLPKIDPNFFRKYPTTIALILVTTIAGYFTRSFIESSNSRSDDYIQVINQYKIQLTYKDSIIADKDQKLYDLQQQLLISNGIIERLPGKLDSLAQANKKKK